MVEYVSSSHFSHSSVPHLSLCQAAPEKVALLAKSLLIGYGRLARETDS